MAKIAQLPQQGSEPEVDNEIPYVAPSPQPISRMQWCLLGLLFCFALFLRGYDMSKPVGSTGDEYHYPWVGLSILHGEPPTAWSYLKAYDERNLHLGKIAHNSQFSPIKYIFVPVRPAFDHPPLYSILSGAFAMMVGGAKPVNYTMDRYVGGQPLEQFNNDPIGSLRIWDLNLGRVRYLSLVLFAWSFVMLFGVAWRAYSFSAAFWCCLFFTTISHIIIHQRAVVTESLVTPLLLTNIYFVQSYLAGRMGVWRFGIWTMVLTAAALLTKLIAASQAPVIALLLLAAGKRRESLFPIAGALLGLALYFTYGWMYGWADFWGVLGSQSLRFGGFDSIESIILKPQLFHHPNFNYVLFAGWLATFAMLIAARGASLFAAPLAYLAGFVFFAAASDIYGWHIMCFYPFLCLGLGLLASKAWKGDDSMAYLLIVTLFLPFLFQTCFLADGKGDTSLFRYAYLALAGLLLGGIFYLPGTTRRWGFRIATGALLGLVMLSEVITAYKFLFN